MKKIIPLILIATAVLLLVTCGIIHLRSKSTNEGELNASESNTYTEDAAVTDASDITQWSSENDTTAQPTQPSTQQSRYPTLPTTGAPAEPEGQFLFSTVDFDAAYPIRTDNTEICYRITDGFDFFYLGEIIDAGDNEAYSYNVRTGDLIEITSGPKDVSRLEIPKEIDGKAVAFIGPKAFRNCAAQELVLPDTILAVGDYAFKGSKQLKTVRLSKNLIALCLSCFSTCPNLTTCEIPTSVEGLGERAFEECKKLSSSVHLSPKCKLIGSYCFAGCVSVNEITMSEGLVSVEDHAFAATSIKTCVLPQSVVDCGAAAFASCSRLEAVEFPKEFRTDCTLGGGMFGECVNLKSVTLPENIIGITGEAFIGCKSLMEIHIPKTVSYISSHAFMRCSSLKDVYFETANCAMELSTFSEDAGVVLHAPAGGSIQQYCLFHPLLSFSAS